MKNIEIGPESVHLQKVIVCWCELQEDVTGINVIFVDYISLCVSLCDQ